MGLPVVIILRIANVAVLLKLNRGTDEELKRALCDNAVANFQTSCACFMDDVALELCPQYGCA